MSKVKKFKGIFLCIDVGNSLYVTYSLFDWSICVPEALKTLLLKKSSTSNNARCTIYCSHFVMSNFDHSYSLLRSQFSLRFVRRQGSSLCEKSNLWIMSTLAIKMVTIKSMATSIVICWCHLAAPIRSKLTTHTSKWCPVKEHLKN